MKRGRLRQVLVTMVLAALLAVCKMETAFCAVPVEVDRDCSLSLEYQYNESGLSGVSVSLFRVADISTEAEFTLSGAFGGYPVSLQELDDTGWKTAANTLATYVRADSIQPNSTVVTDGNGKINWGKLTTGLYLLIAQDKVSGGKTFQTSPFLVSLPGLTNQGGWSYEVTVNPKVSVTIPSDDPSTPGGDNDSTHITVVKVWNDGGASALRPESIKVTLLRNGESYRTVDLTALNYWRYTWSGLETGYTWTVLEPKVPDGYTVTYTGEYTIRTITNTATTPTGPGGEDTPSGSEIIAENPPGIPPENLSEILPETGLLQWPIPVLAIVGMLLFAFGWNDYMKKSDKDDEA